MKSYLRFLSRNKLYTAIEVVGLSIALAFVIPMICYNTEISKVSKGNKNYKNIYSICFADIQASSPGLGKYLLETVPEIESVTSPLVDTPEIIELFECRTDKVDKEFFEFFPCDFIEGDSGFLDIPNAVAVSAEFASKLSEDGNVIGMTIRGERNDYTVAAVFENYGNGIFKECDVLKSNAPFIMNNMSDYPFGNNGAMTIFSVKKGSDMAEVTAKVRKAAIEFWSPQGETYKNEIFYRLVRYDKMTTDNSAFFINKNSVEGRWILGAICIILFTVALLNYINLNVALTTKRAKEMAMRKLNGAGNGTIILKYCYESIVFTAVCFIAGVLLTQITVPILNSFMDYTGMGGSEIVITWTRADILMYIAIILITGLICGLVPAAIVSRFTPLDVSKGDFRYHSKKYLSRIFIGFQSLLSVILIAITLTMENSYRNMKNAEFNCNIDDVFVFRPQYPMEGHSQQMLPLLEQYPEILQVGMIDFNSAIPGITGSEDICQSSDGDYLFGYSCLHCDENGFKILEFPILERYDNKNYIGVWTTPMSEKAFAEHPGSLERIMDKEHMRNRNITGRISDFPASAATDRKDIVTMVFVSDGKDFRFPSLLIKTGDNHKKALEIIATAYEEVSGESFSELMESESRDSGYIQDIHIESLAPFYALLNMLRVVLVLIILMTMMGLTGMSIYFTSEKKNEIAIRKVFGGTSDSEMLRNTLRYLRMTLIADLLAIPAIYLLMNLMQRTVAEKVQMSWWIYIVAIVISLLISLAAVLWQTLRASRTNPAEALKKE